MTHSQKVRQYCVSRFLEAARKESAHTVEVPVRAIHDGVGLKGRFPLVCSALQTRDFLREQGIQGVEIRGPYQSSTTVLVFSL
jgi:hypothetical protein